MAKEFAVPPSIAQEIGDTTPARPMRRRDSFRKLEMARPRICLALAAAPFILIIVLWSMGYR